MYKYNDTEGLAFNYLTIAIYSPFFLFIYVQHFYEKDVINRFAKRLCGCRGCS
jgi:hypothetical protein